MVHVYPNAGHISRRRPSPTATITKHILRALEWLETVCCLADTWATRPFLDRLKRCRDILLALKHSLSGTFDEGTMSELYGASCYHLFLSVLLTICMCAQTACQSRSAINYQRIFRD
jgi:hypothetical protein